MSPNSRVRPDHALMIFACRLRTWALEGEVLARILVHNHGKEVLFAKHAAWPHLSVWREISRALLARQRPRPELEIGPWEAEQVRLWQASLGAVACLAQGKLQIYSKSLQHPEQSVRNPVTVFLLVCLLTQPQEGYVLLIEYSFGIRQTRMPIFPTSHGLWMESLNFQPYVMSRDPLSNNRRKEGHLLTRQDCTHQGAWAQLGCLVLPKPNEIPMCFLRDFADNTWGVQTCAVFGCFKLELNPFC